MVVEDARILDELDADGIWTRLAQHFDADGAGRVQDAWQNDPAVRAIATHPAVIGVLRMLYDREPYPFQTLNFLSGTEQRTHSDTIHFSSLPSGFMCGVWMALEDVSLRQGPLHYFPGSQLLPEFDYEHLGVPAVEGEQNWDNPNTRASYAVYEDRIDALARENGFRREELDIKRGTFLIWSANLLHGGSPRDDRTLTRKSQVTHYYFADAVPFTPMFSRRSEGALRRAARARHPHRPLGRAVARRHAGGVSGRRRRAARDPPRDRPARRHDARRWRRMRACRSRRGTHWRSRPGAWSTSCAGRAKRAPAEPRSPVSDAQSAAIDRARERLSALQVRL